jgi:hypothetical protein
MHSFVPPLTGGRDWIPSSSTMIALIIALSALAGSALAVTQCTAGATSKFITVDDKTLLAAGGGVVRLLRRLSCTPLTAL